MNNKITNTIKKNNLLQNDNILYIAVSGGSDSMSLLFFFIKNKALLNIKEINVCHINHMFRGQDSYKDEKLVKDFCDKYNINTYILRKDVSKLAKYKKKSFELMAREVRYSFLNSFIKNGNEKIVTAHNLNDRIETFIFNSIRGTSLDGLCSIPFKRGNIIRPLLETTKEEVFLYCKENKIPYCTDHTNFENKYSRNKIRNKILPIYSEINNSYLESFQRLFISLQEDKSYINKKVDDYIAKNLKGKTLDLQNFDILDISIKKRCIKNFLNYNNLNYDEKIINIILEMIDKKSGKLQIAFNKFILVKENLLNFKQIVEFSKEINNFDYSYSLENDNIKIYNNLYFKSKVVSKNYYEKINKKVFDFALDYDKIKKISTLRNKRKNDFITFIDRKHTKLLKKFFNEQKVDISLRNKLPVIAVGNFVLHVFGFNEIKTKFSVSEETNFVFLGKYEGDITK